MGYNLEKNPVSNNSSTVGAYDRSFNGGWYDTFVFKLSADGSTLLYSTFVGGSGSEVAVEAMVLDSANNAYVTGCTGSSDFPTTTGAYDETHNGNHDAFVFKLSADGSSLVYSTFLGGYNSSILFDDGGQGISLDDSNNAYITGFTASNNFPTTSGAYDESYNGGYDVFVAKMSPEGDSLLYSTFIGGINDEFGEYDGGSVDISLDNTNNAYIAGNTASTNFPTTSGAYDESHNGAYDVFIAKLNSNGDSLLYSTFMGGNGDDLSGSVALDGDMNVCVAGYTNSDDFITNSGNNDVWLFKMAVYDSTITSTTSSVSTTTLPTSTTLPTTSSTSPTSTSTSTPNSTTSSSTSLSSSVNSIPPTSTIETTPGFLILMISVVLFVFGALRRRNKTL